MDTIAPYRKRDDREEVTASSEPNADLATLTVVVSDGTRICVRHTRFAPKRPVCVLIHGNGDGSFVWNRTIRNSSEMCTLVAIDLRGHGDSSNSASDYGLEKHLDDVSAVLEVLSIDKFAVIGHSLGGMIAMYLAGERYQDRVLAAMLVDISPNPNPECVRHVRKGFEASMRLYASREEYVVELMNARPMLSADAAHELAAHGLRCRGEFFERKLDPAYLSCNATPKSDEAALVRLLSSMRCWTFVVRGEASAMVSASAAQQMCRELRAGYPATIPRAGHAVMSDNPLGFETVVREFCLRLLHAATAANTSN